ncbi:DUF4907 domain-containing protein [Halosquirtibacter xylanolyticus]|uniref:DUF4907 domain-containing protein n=1 Tax=Halosquirtibacter xylanolyticus TaxID=3374599 RepID=UPI0037478C83|nr:DUF4907 domain-containing protein [Prolixibacteraceae bacterium]
MKQRRKLIIVLLLATIISIVVGKKIINKQDDTLHNISVKVEKVEGGYGYKIMIDDHCYIEQPYIPAIPGRQPFESYDDALNAGTLVAKKISENKSPSLNINELKQLNIIK